MKKIQQFNKTNVSQVRDLIENTLKALEGYNINVSVGNITYTDNSFTAKITTSILGDSGEVKSPEVISWESGDYRRHSLNLKESDLNREFTFNNERYAIVGCKERRCQRGIIGKRLRDGKLFAINAVDVIRGF